MHGEASQRYRCRFVFAVLVVSGPLVHFGNESFTISAVAANFDRHKGAQLEIMVKGVNYVLKASSVSGETQKMKRVTNAQSAALRVPLSTVADMPHYKQHTA